MDSGSWFLIILGLVIFNFLFSTVLEYINHLNWKDLIPNELKDFYKPKKYKKAREYSIRRNKISLISSLFGFVLIIGLLCFNGYGYINDFSLNYNSSYIQSGVFFIVLYFISSIISIPFSYYNTFVIEEKFGFNKTTKKTFFLDIMKSFIITLIIGSLLLFPSIYLFETLESGFWRSTKANAFFSGLGPKKTIALYDTLIEKHTDDELVAVLAHEVGHYKKKHIFSGLLLTIIQLGITVFFLEFCLKQPEISYALGGNEMTFHLGLIGFSFIFSPISLISGIFMNYLSRKNEFEADSYAKETFSGEHLSLALKKLSVDSLSNIYPHPAYVFIHYSHPPLIKRLEALK